MKKYSIYVRILIGVFFILVLIYKMNIDSITITQETKSAKEYNNDEELYECMKKSDMLFVVLEGNDGIKRGVL